MTASSQSHWPVTGHGWAVEQLSRAIEHDRVRHAYLITGPDQIGKTTLARVFAAALNCTGARPPCGQCRACSLIAKDGHPDVSLIESGQKGGTLKIAQVRELQQTLSLRPYEVRYRVAILCRFHEAHIAAANAMLKTLEEPSQYVVLILTANSTDQLLPTIVSRCQPLNLRPLPVEAVQTALEHQWGAPPDTAHTLARLSGGRMGWAVHAYQDAAELEYREQAIDTLEAALLGTRRDRFALVEQITPDKPALLTMLDLWQGYWRDVLLVASGSQTPINNYDRAAGIRDLARLVGPDAAQRALHATHHTIEHVGKNVNTRLALEVLMLSYPSP
jgi:DNA polymerase-3 subunit delta'